MERRRAVRVPPPKAGHPKHEAGSRSPTRRSTVPGSWRASLAFAVGLSPPLLCRRLCHDPVHGGGGPPGGGGAGCHGDGQQTGVGLQPHALPPQTDPRMVWAPRDCTRPNPQTPNHSKHRIARGRKVVQAPSICAHACPQLLPQLFYDVIQPAACERPWVLLDPLVRVAELDLG